MLRPLVHTPIGLVGGVSVLLLQLADEAVLLAPDFLKLVVGQLAPLFPRVAFELFPLALDDVPVHLRLPLSTDSGSTVAQNYPPTRNLSSLTDHPLKPRPRSAGSMWSVA